jgi:2-keto-myo-inositol isomerase
LNPITNLFACIDRRSEDGREELVKNLLEETGPVHCLGGMAMGGRIYFALNHITTPRLDSRAFIDLAARIGCVGVELRNDLADKKLTDRPFFDGEEPNAIGAYARGKGMRLLGLSEVYGFNRWSEEIRAKVDRLIKQAKESGAESISLIPSNDGAVMTDEARLAGLRHALQEILPMVESADIVALVEPLGFPTSSLRRKREAVDAIEAVGGRGRYKLVHDTFHHYLAGEDEFFPDDTGIVHISGVVDRRLTADEMQDGHRILVTPEDRLGNAAQIAALRAAHYNGAFSYEPFAASVHAASDIEGDLRASMALIEAGIAP